MRKKFPKLVAHIWWKGFSVFIYRRCPKPRIRATVLEIRATLPDNSKLESKMAITFTAGGTASQITMTPYNKDPAEGGVRVDVDGTPTVELSAELQDLLTYTPGPDGFTGELRAVDDLGSEVVTGTLTASVDAAVGPDVSMLVGVLEIHINPPAAQATIFQITATDPA